MLLVYIDDIILAGSDLSILTNVKHALQSLFKLKDLGSLKYFLGLEIAKSSTGIFLSQRKYTLSLLDETGFLASKPTTLPMDPNLKINQSDGELLQDITQYRRLIWRLSYLTLTRPDIAFTVNKLSQYASKPHTSHLAAIHHLLKYLKNSPGQGLFFPSNTNLNLTAYADAN